MITSWRTITTTISDPFITTHSQLTNMNAKSFYITVLRQFAETGADMLTILDDIVSGKTKFNSDAYCPATGQPTTAVAEPTSEWIDF